MNAMIDSDLRFMKEDRVRRAAIEKVKSHMLIPKEASFSGLGMALRIPQTSSAKRKGHFADMDSTELSFLFGNSQ